MRVPSTVKCSSHSSPAWGRPLFDAPEKGGRQIRGEEALPILGEDRMVPDLVVHGQAYKPAKQEVVIQLLHQESFAADGVQHLEEQSPEQRFRGWRGRPSREYMAWKSRESSRKA